MEYSPELIVNNPETRRFIEEYAEAFAIPGLPADVIREIAKKDPKTYRRLLLTSKRLRTIVQPVLEEVCEHPITAREIINYINTDIGKPGFEREKYILVTPLSPYNKEEPNNLLYRSTTIWVQKVSAPSPSYFPGQGHFERIYRRQARLYNRSEPRRTLEFDVVRDNYYRSGELTESRSYPADYRNLEPVIDQLLNEGYRPDITDVYKILARRTSCLKINPKWIIDRTINSINYRYQDIIKKIETYPPELLNDVTFEQINKLLLPLLIRRTKEAKEEYDNLPTEEDKYLFIVENFDLFLLDIEDFLRQDPELSFSKYDY